MKIKSRALIPLLAAVKERRARGETWGEISAWASSVLEVEDWTPHAFMQAAARAERQAVRFPAASAPAAPVVAPAAVVAAPANPAPAAAVVAAPVVPPSVAERLRAKAQAQESNNENEVDEIEELRRKEALRKIK